MAIRKQQHMTDWTFHPTLVAPFYLHFMGGNIITLSSVEERRAILNEFRSRARELSDSQLQEMLRSSWRPSLMAPWYIAQLGRMHFLPQVEQMLLTRPAYVLPLCICLARLGNDSSRKALLSYLEGCAQGELQQNGYDETIEPEAALCALEFMDPDAVSRQGQALWMAFLDRQKQSMMGMRCGGRPSTEQDVAPYLQAWNKRLAQSRQLFPQLMSLFKMN